MSLKTASALVLAATSVVNGAALPAKRDDFSIAIVGGERAGQGEFPFIVSLQQDGIGHFCGGSLIDASTVVTAAHCVVDKAPGQFRIQAGSNTLFVGGVNSDVAKIAVHPNYVSGSLPWDFATLGLTAPISGENIAFVGLPEANADPAGGATGTVVGWGNTASDQGLSNDLNKVNLPVVDRNTCRGIHGDAVTDDMVCAGGAGGQSACQGDSGGPYIVDGILQGIVSWGPGKCDDPQPSVFSRVSVALDFINSNRG